MNTTVTKITRPIASAMNAPFARIAGRRNDMTTSPEIILLVRPTTQSMRGLSRLQYEGHPSEWVPFKQWVLEEAELCGVRDTAIYTRVNKGKYPRLQRHSINQRVINVSHP
jgi:hypothetical protein